MATMYLVQHADNDLLDKAEAWKLVIDDQGKLIEHDTIRRDQLSLVEGLVIGRERERL